MVEQLGLRERKKAETLKRIRVAALHLFMERGFDKVSTADIAAAAEVSKMTLFNYFATKEDLVMGPIEEHVDEAALVVRDRPAGESPVAALRRHHLAALAARDPVTGLSDTELFISMQRMVLGTPSLMLRVLHFHRLRAEAL